jgi:hypothetical protein
MPVVYEAPGLLGTGTVVVPVDGPQDRWTVAGSCGCVACQREAFADGGPMRLVLVRESDGLVGTCVAPSRVTVASEEGEIDD